MYLFWTLQCQFYKIILRFFLTTRIFKQLQALFPPPALPNNPMDCSSLHKNIDKVQRLKPSESGLWGMGALQRPPIRFDPIRTDCGYTPWRCENKSLTDWMGKAKSNNPSPPILCLSGCLGPVSAFPHWFTCRRERGDWTQGLTPG